MGKRARKARRFGFPCNPSDGPLAGGKLSCFNLVPFEVVLAVNVTEFLQHTEINERFSRCDTFAPYLSAIVSPARHRKASGEPEANIPIMSEAN